jgi:hypothetical protein
MPLSPNRPAVPARPAVDEWGIYDPSQAGLPAVLERLEARRRSSDADVKGMAISMRQAHELTKKPGD